MPERPVKDLAASVRARLTSLARQRGEDFQFVLTRYAVERLLYRLGRSAHADSFILKGAMLFAAWTNEPHRPTRDVDLLGFGDGSAGRILSVFADLCTMAVDVPDGLRFDAVSITLVAAAHQEYPGQCVKLKCHLGDAAIPLSIDIGFGDAVVPPARNSNPPESARGVHRRVFTECGEADAVECVCAPRPARRQKRRAGVRNPAVGGLRMACPRVAGAGRGVRG